MSNTHTHTHTHTVSFVIHRLVEPRLMIRSNHDTCRHGLPLFKIMGYQHREDAVGGGGSKQWQIHTHTHGVSIVIHRMDGGSGKDRTHLDTCKCGPP